jgi:sarcosine oxidase subunit beta
MGGSRRAVVIGGGITGVLTARELLLAGWEVTLLERSHLGAGSSSRTAAGIRQQFSTRATVIGMRYAVDFYKRFQEEVESGQSPIAQRGYLFLLEDEGAWEEARERVSLQQEAGLAEVEALEGPTLFERFPWLDPAVVRGATWCPTDGFLYPTLVYQECARRVRELGGQIVQRAPVTGAQREGGRLTALTTPKGCFTGDLFFDCTNAWSPRLTRLLGATELPITPIKRYLWFVRRDGGMSARTLQEMPLVITASGAYGRPENADTLLMGWAHAGRAEPDFTDEDQDLVEPAFSHDTGVDALPYEAWAKMAASIPPIGEFGGITATTAGYYGVTPDHNPFLGYDPAVHNLVHLAGFSGHGAMFGPFSARVAAALAEAGQDVERLTLPQGEVSLADFSPLRVLGRPERMVI